MPKTVRIGFTTGNVKAFKIVGTGQAFMWDSGCPGLGVRATAGSKSYVFQSKKLGGRTVRITIGSTKVWKLGKARERAQELAVMMSKGEDPRDVEAEQRAAEKREELLLSDVWEKYLKAHKDQWGDRHYADNLWHARGPDPEKEGDKGGVLWPLLQKNLASVDAGALTQWAKDAVAVHKAKLAVAKKARGERLKAEKKAPEGAGARRKVAPTTRGLNIRGANAALRQGYLRARALWRWAYQRDEYADAMADPSMFNHSDLCALLPKITPKKDVLEKGQLEAWFNAVRAIDNKVISTYLQVLLLTGARRNELGGLKWSEVDFKWKAIWLKDKIEEEGRKVPLTPYCEFSISSLPRRNEWVFSSVRSESGRLVEPRIAHKRALAVAGLPSDMSLHGLRRSFVSLAEWVEMPAGITAQLCGHRPSAVQEKHYRRRPLDLLALWSGKFESWILQEAEIPFDPEKIESGLRVVE